MRPAHSAIYSMSTGRYFPGVKRPQRKVNHSVPSSDVINNVWSHTWTLDISLHGVDSDNFYFLHIMGSTRVDADCMLAGRENN
jgi:hypothetical protein